MVRVEVAVSGTALVIEDGDLSRKLTDAAIYEGFAACHAGVVNQVTCFQIVGCIDDDVILGNGCLCILPGQPERHGVEGASGIQG